MGIEYCIPCERYADVLPSGVHLKYMHLVGEPVEVDGCEGPFATCPPPEDLEFLEEDWRHAFDNEPDPNEMIKMDEEAENLLMELM